MIHYRRPALLAITVGVAATGGALAILLADPVTTGNWRLDHVLLPVVVAITIAAGHLSGSALRGWRILPAMGFALIFAVGTVLTVYSSVGAQKSGAGARQEASAAFRNNAIESKRAELKRARDRLDMANAMTEREMTGSRCGGRCNDWKLRAQEVQAHVDQLDRELQGMGALQVAPSKARPFAEAMGVLGFDARQVEIIAATFEPFAFSLLFELTAIVAFGFGLGGHAPARREPAQIVATDFDTSDVTDDELEKLRRLLQGVRGGVNNRRLAVLLGCSEGQASKVTTAAIAAGVATRQKVGREVRISSTLH